MASATNITLRNGETLNIGANQASSVLSLPPGSSQFQGVLKVENGVGATVTARIEHSPDRVNWFTVLTLTQAGNGVDIDSSVQLWFPNVRTDIDVAGAAADVTCQLWFDPGKR